MTDLPTMTHPDAPAGGTPDDASPSSGGELERLREYRETNDAVTEVSVNGRNALQADIPTGGCAIAIEVGEHARALVQVALVTSPRDPQACVDAQALAEKLEPLLPKVQ